MKALAKLGVGLAVAAALGLSAGGAFAQKAPKGQNGTTLAAYKTIDICTVPAGSPNAAEGMWKFFGEISVWNEGAVDTTGFNINDYIQGKNLSGPNWTTLATVVLGAPYPMQIPAGTTEETATTFPYKAYVDPLSPVDLMASYLYFRNVADITITNHSGQLGKPFGPSPKATYTGAMPPPTCMDEGGEMGCTLTAGYWQQHSLYGNAQRDEWWDTVGEDTSFFDSGTTWYGAISTVPKGNGYWILANQFVAAVLNQNKGAFVPAGVQTTLNLAAGWFASELPTTCATAGSCGLQKTWAAILDDYNNGIYEGGPPHCE